MVHTWKRSNQGSLLPFEKRFEQAKILVKEEGTTNPKYGKNPKNNTMQELLQRGIVVIDKPPGPTSHQVADYAKKVLKISKAGHSGTLDPAVTGVLPVALQKSTRITHALLSAGKEYVCLMHIHKDISDEELDAVLKKFTGKISQLPPKKSAVKRQIRERKIYYINLLEREERDVLFIVGCQAGTYIRKLVHDIGERLGCGAHMAELRRTKAGPFNEDMAVTLQDLTDAFHFYKEGDESYLRKIIYPVEFGVKHLKKIWVFDEAIGSMCHGAYLKVPGISKLDSDIQQEDTVAVMSLKDELVLVGKAMMHSRDMFGSKRGIAIQTQQVFMKAGVYPKDM